MNLNTYFTGITGVIPPQVDVLTQALTLTNYNTVANATLTALNDHVPPETADSIRAMAYYIATLNGGNPDAGTILHTIATATWEAIGLEVDARPALTWEQRAGIIATVMGVSKSIIAEEAVRLEALAWLDTTLPEIDPDPVEPE